jgi:hypothetical protein
VHQGKQEIVKLSRSPEEVANHLWKLACLPIVGMAALLVADGRYPLVDSNRLFEIAVLIVFAPLPFILYGYCRSHLPHYERWLKPLAIICSVLIFSLVVLDVANGAMDSNSPYRVSVLITEKDASRGRSAMYYRFEVTSWRSGHEKEMLNVKDAVYWRYGVGDYVNIEVHPGKFGVPWFVITTS